MRKLAFGLVGIAALVAATPAASQGIYIGPYGVTPVQPGLDIRTTLRGGDTMTILGRGLDTTTTLGRGLEFTTTLGRGVEAVNILGIRTPTRTADAAGPPSAVREAW